MGDRADLAVVHAVHRAARGGRDVRVSAPERRQRGERVVSVATSSVLDVGRLVRELPGASIYMRGDRATPALDVYYSPEGLRAAGRRVSALAVACAWLLYWAAT